MAKTSKNYVRSFDLIADIIQYRFISASFKTFNDILIESVNSDYNYRKDRRLGFIICFSVVMFIAYLTIWTPFIRRMNREI